MLNILVLTNIYPADDLEHEDTPVVHYFTREWIKMGYNVRVINYPANFPKVFMWGASFIRKNLSSIMGTTVRTYPTTEKEYEWENVKVKRIPLIKFKPHCRYSKQQIGRAFDKTVAYLTKENFKPDCIISHWVNPQLEIMDRLKDIYKCKICYVAHTSTVEFEHIYTDEYSQALIDNIDLIGFRSAYIRDAFCRKFCYERRSFQCYSGIPEKYIPEKSIARSFTDIRNFVFVGTLIKRKYPAEIIPALVKAFGKDKFNVTYIGQGAETKRIEKFAQQFGAKENVHCIGYIPRDKVVEELQTNDVFVMISRHETFGLVYLEAMAQGLITIASRKEGFDGIIEHGKNGFLCESGNYEELSELICKIRKMSPDVLRLISDNAIKTARNLTDKRAAQTYIDAVADCSIEQ